MDVEYEQFDVQAGQSSRPISKKVLLKLPVLRVYVSCACRACDVLVMFIARSFLLPGISVAAA